MSESVEQLTALPQDIARHALSDVSLLSASAYADAAVFAAEQLRLFNEFQPLLDGTDNDYVVAGEAFDKVADNFRGSLMDKLIEKAFTTLSLLIEARSITDPKPGEREYLYAEHRGNLEEQQKQIADAVANERLPASCQKYFDEGLAIATAALPQQKWVDAAKARTESLQGRAIP